MRTILIFFIRRKLFPHLCAEALCWGGGGGEQFANAQQGRLLRACLSALLLTGCWEAELCSAQVALWVLPPYSNTAS